MASLYFYYDLASPRAWLAALETNDLLQRSDTPVSWHPCSQAMLDDLTGAAASPPVDTWSAAKTSLLHADLLRQARQRGARLHPAPLADPPRDLPTAMGLLASLPATQRPALSLTLLRALWQDGLDLSDPGVLRRLAAAHGLEEAALSVDPAAAGDALRALTAAAAARGVFAVPTVATAERSWWGLDRLPLARRALGLPAPPSPPAPSASAAPGVSQVRFFHDLSSPFSYLGATQIASLAAARGVSVAWTPILLGALFREIGTPNVPLLAMSAARQAYLRQDLDDWAAWWGVPLRFPSVFPVRTVLPLRVCLLAPEATLPLYRALWVEDRDIGAPSVVRAVLDDLGLDGAGLVEATQQPAVKARLQENTVQARERGVCGVPTIEVGGVLLWGQDQLPRLAAMLEGRYEIR